MTILATLLPFLPLGLVSAQLYPAALPLAVRSPYLNTYLNAVDTSVPDVWPRAYNLNRVLGWSGIMRVDGTSYELWGNGIGNPANLTSYEFSPTRSIMNVRAGAMDVKVTWLSPIEPDDLVLQSLPFAYVSVEASSNDGSAHTVQVYSDISCEWASGDDNSPVTWQTTQTDTTIYHQCQRETMQTAQEINGIAEDGTVYYGFAKSSDATFESGPDKDVRNDFKTSGVLRNSVDKVFRNLNDNYPVFAHAIDLHSITSTSSPVTFAIGLVRDPAITYSLGVNNQTRSSYFFSKYAKVGDAVNFFVGDFGNADSRATDIDNKLLSAAKEVSDEYADIISLTARQALAVDITIAKASDGSYNTDDVMSFLRNTGGEGSDSLERRSNPVEVLYAAFPTYLYLNPSWAGSFLEPLLKYQASSSYARDYAAPDLGATYPYISGNSDPNIFEAIEDCGDMLIMGWAHARYSGDGAMLQTYYSTYKKYADYLIAHNAATPNGYTDANGQDNANMTNLALKGILGVRAMAEISDATGNGDDSKAYSNKASSWISIWKNAADTQGHLVSEYNQPSSWALMYNMYADKLLGLNLVPDSVYTEQDSFYASQASVAGEFGLQFDSNVANTVKSHWTLFTAAASSDSGVRKTLVSMVHAKASSNETVGVFPTTYNANNGSLLAGFASPAQGAAFSILALNLKSQAVHTDGSSKSNVGAIAGGVVGGVLGAALLGFAAFWFWRRRRNNKGDDKGQEAGWYNPAPDNQAMSDQYAPRPFDPYTGTVADQGHGGTTTTVHGAQPFFMGAPTITSDQSRTLPPLPPSSGGGDNVPGYMASPHSGSTVYPAPQSGKAAMMMQHQYSSTGEAPVPRNEGSAGGSAYGGSSSDNPPDALRNEVEVLRREMEEMRARTGYEPPPQYT